MTSRLHAHVWKPGSKINKNSQTDAQLLFGVACVCSPYWMAGASQPPQCLCHQACRAAPAAAPADLLHPNVAGAADLAPVAVSSGARRE